MQIAFRTHDLGVKGVPAAIAKCKECNIDAVQLVAYKFIDEIAYKPNALNAENSLALGKALKEAGIKVGLIGAYFNPVHSNAQKVAACKAVFKDYITYAHSLGCNIVGSETGSYNDDKWTYNPKNRTEEAFQIVVETFRELAAFAKERGVYVGMEGAAGHCCYDVATLKRAIDTIGADNIRVIFDLYNYLDSSNYTRYLDILDEGLKTFAGKIVIFHIKDFIVVEEEGKPKLKQVAPGKGMFDFDAILHRIKAYDKDAILVLEGTTGEDIITSSDFIKTKWQQV
jgi:sugar phosphate isomerase/epimerase